MDNKTVSIVSYITLIGWLIAYFSGKEKADDFAKYHLRQGLGLIIFSFVLGFTLQILMSVTHIFALSYISFISIFLLIIGIINASNGARKPLPIIGGFFENKFSFIG
ncbi:DUF4870 domain-containing protein [Chitinophaga sp. 212800010-3]|uniref:DUF4870 domain-containing protein n=1 Tax=unclassified Chitinophaga TaxID=2619133 RepID=UPI002DE7B6C9|nr:Import component protein [Chitinophaga sp. 212800010-3]